MRSSAVNWGQSTEARPQWPLETREDKLTRTDHVGRALPPIGPPAGGELMGRRRGALIVLHRHVIRMENRGAGERRRALCVLVCCFLFFVLGCDFYTPAS